MIPGFALALAFLLNSAALQPSPPPFDTEGLVAVIRPSLPRPFPGGLTFREVSVEDGVLVALVSGPRASFDALGREEVARVFAAGFCRGPSGRPAFAAGFRMRLDTLDDDGTGRTRGLVIDHCPDPVAEKPR